MPSHADQILRRVRRRRPPSFDYGEYGRAFAGRYDELYGGENDVQAITDAVLALMPHAGGDGRLLELGVGTGRLAIPLARAGVNVTGVDISPEMLAMCNRKYTSGRLRLVRGDVRDLRHLGLGRFPLVLYAFNSILHLLTEDEQRRSLIEAAQHLTPAGVVVLEVTAPARVRPILPVGLSVRSVSADQLTVRVRCRFIDHRVVGAHIELSPGSVSVRRFSHRYLRFADVLRIAHAAGLVVRSTHSNWILSHPSDGTYPTIFVLARRETHE